MYPIIDSNLKFLFEILVICLLRCCLGQSGGMIALGNSETEPEVSEVLSKKELKSVYDVAKNISHSKGSIVKSNEGDFEYRRSFTSKVEIEVNSLHLQNIINVIKKNITQNSFNKQLLLQNLDFLENIVHQYDVGKKFADIGGFQLILSLITNENDEVSKAAFTTLSAALQGNQEVQTYATTTDLLKHINMTLTSSSPNQASSALFTLSAFVRNCPEALFSFLKENGLHTLSNLLTDHYSDLKIQLRIINIFRDITTEIYDDNSDTVFPLLLIVKKSFERDFKHYFICERLVVIFITSKKYEVHEKVVAAMSAMYEICQLKFKESDLIKDVKFLMKLYDPCKAIKLWYEQQIDSELKYYIYQDLEEFSTKLLSDKSINY